VVMLSSQPATRPPAHRRKVGGAAYFGRGGQTLACTHRQPSTSRA